ncbi:biliverdin-producing heme oxygenase [Alteromonas sp. ASW11-36]|uniref:Biliverdin-producing heme oxygenase n=1 Tax=Alteromonas arenosi TaxID=3055817 RepID=A0ABT7SVS7_9ALTE|nr:biliverdin-producing heme oxygenase [Alteromonas sp. ASW11-36]MDM7860250.1 biliverdin-producing heme oxygenase [Alteromonas sp. ASW11-36]
MTLLERLRIETHELHKELESKYPFNRLLSKELSARDYACVLRCLNAWYEEIEPEILKVCELDVNVVTKYEASTPFLHMDLKALGETPQKQLSALQALPLNSELVLGYLYVVLGSANGATQIKRHMQKNNMKLPVNFYTKSVNDILIWKSFVEDLKVRDKTFTEQQKKDVIQGASSAFESLININSLLS